MVFLDGHFNEELFWLSFGDIISNVVISTVIIAEIGFVIWLLLKWFHKNVKFNWSPVLKIGESARRRVDSSIETFDEKVKKDMGPVEVGVKKNIILSDADESNIKSDEVKKGKVKTQKDKLKKLRGR
tara:strand:- start:119 stop:499 length:381 start_codon:yes stop_codon:yes gene_type:complete